MANKDIKHTTFIDNWKPKPTKIDWEKFIDTKKTFVSADPKYVVGVDLNHTPSIPEEMKGKFILKLKSNNKYVSGLTETSSFGYDAKVFDCVMDALSFADNIQEEVIVDIL